MDADEKTAVEFTQTEIMRLEKNQKMNSFTGLEAKICQLSPSS